MKRNLAAAVVGRLGMHGVVGSQDTAEHHTQHDDSSNKCTDSQGPVPAAQQMVA